METCSLRSSKAINVSGNESEERLVKNEEEKGDSKRTCVEVINSVRERISSKKFKKPLANGRFCVRPKTRGRYWRWE